MRNFVISLFSNLNLSIELTGVISTAVPVRKASSQCFKNLNHNSPQKPQSYFFFFFCNFNYGLSSNTIEKTISFRGENFFVFNKKNISFLCLMVIVASGNIISVIQH